MATDSSTINLINAGGSVLAGIAVVAGTGYVFHSVLIDNNTSGFGAVALLILLGLASFLGLIAVFSLLSSWIGILDPKQAFGLPEGSIRAVLTMAFIVIVSVLASFLITNSDENSPFNERNALTLAMHLPLADAQAFIKATQQTDGLLALKPAATLAADASVARPAAEPFYDVVFYPHVDHRLKEDISKQILTMLSTILAAMIGFYFGSRPGETDSDAPKRAQAAVQIEKTIGGLPKITDLIDRTQKLIDQVTAAGQTAARDQLQTLKSRLSSLQDIVEQADKARLSQATTLVEMTNSAAAVTSAAAEIAAAKKTIEDYESQS